MVYVLGVSAFYHDSAAALVHDGVVVAAAQEERFSRVKNDADFPSAAVRYCLEQAGIGLSDVDRVAFYDKPILTFDRLQLFAGRWIQGLSYPHLLIGCSPIRTNRCRGTSSDHQPGCCSQDTHESCHSFLLLHFQFIR